MGIDEATLATIVGRLTEAASPARIILFGSLAAGTATRDSDIDLLVVEDEVDDVRAESVRLRMALGADRLGVLRMVLGQVAVTTAAGLAVGVPATLALTRIVQSQLYGIPAHDPLSILAAAAG